MFKASSKATLVLGAVLSSVINPQPAQAQLDDTPIFEQVVFGIGRGDARLLRYDYGTQTGSVIGTIEAVPGQPLTGIDASAHIPTHLNIYAFWTNPADGQARLVYINRETAAATLVGDPLGPGIFTGATAIPTPGSSDPTDYTVFAIYQTDNANPPPPDAETCTPVTGELGINPNNSEDNQFTLTLPDETTFTRDDLHDKDVELTPDGVFYQGPAASVRIKPKGGASSLTVAGETVVLSSNTTYTVSGHDMAVTVYNDHVNKQGRAMGHWHLRIDAGCAKIGDGAGEPDTTPPPPPPSKPSGLYRVDHQTGQMVLVMELTGEYQSLAAVDNSRYLASNGTKVYALDPASNTETLLGDALFGTVMAMEFANSSMLMAFENDRNYMIPILVDPGFRPTLPGRLPGFSYLGSIVFMKREQAPLFASALVD